MRTRPSVPSTVHDDDPQAEVVREIRVHGNAAVADEDIIKLAGLTLGQALPAGALEAVEQRLKQSGKFESVEVRKRYRSLTDETDVAIVLARARAAGHDRRSGASFAARHDRSDGSATA